MPHSLDTKALVGETKKGGYSFTLEFSKAPQKGHYPILVIKNYGWEGSGQISN
jgi:hypothetical protein